MLAAWQAAEDQLGQPACSQCALQKRQLCYSLHHKHKCMCWRVQRHKDASLGTCAPACRGLPEQLHRRTSPRCACGSGPGVPSCSSPHRPRLQQHSAPPGSAQPLFIIITSHFIGFRVEPLLMKVDGLQANTWLTSVVSTSDPPAIAGVRSEECQYTSPCSGSDSAHGPHHWHTLHKPDYVWQLKG